MPAWRARKAGLAMGRERNIFKKKRSGRDRYWSIEYGRGSFKATRHHFANGSSNRAAGSFSKR
jgi:hypothetical protein